MESSFQRNGREAYAAEVMPEIGFLKKWKRSTLQDVKVGGMVSKCVPLPPRLRPHRMCPYFISHLSRQTRPSKSLSSKGLEYIFSLQVLILTFISVKLVKLALCYACQEKVMVWFLSQACCRSQGAIHQHCNLSFHIIL